MTPAAVLLIDLENFVLSRFDHFNDEKIRPEDRPTFAEDLKNLVRYALGMAGRPLAVRRAYADFDSLNVNPQELMRQGVEPVQVFRLSGKAANKNAADMKLAMDAVALCGPQFQHFVLISGDADFIPVILELKRRGHTVSVIAVTGATNELIQRFVDNFELFEDLVAREHPRFRARAAQPPAPAPPGPDDLPRIAAAVQRLLARSRPVRFNLVQPLLSKELGVAFDPGAFGCDTTGEFLRRSAPALGVVVRGRHSEQEIDLPGPPAASANGHGGRGQAGPRPGPRAGARPEPHSAAHYKHLLAYGRTGATEAPVLVVPWDALVWVCDAAVPALAPPDGGPATSMELMSRLQRAAHATGAPDLAGHVARAHLAVRGALPVPSPAGVYALAPETTGEHLRHQVLRYIVYVLAARLSGTGVSGPVRAGSVVAMFEPGPALERAATEVAAALAEAAAGPAPEPSPPALPELSPRADEVHTAAGYRRLFQCGGPKGTGETEHARVNPPPWTSFARICDDTFAALSPAAGGNRELQRGQFLERLYAAEKEIGIEGYRSHARRAYALLKLSHAILEDEDRVALHPDVTEPGDIRWAVLGVLLTLVALRLQEKRVPGTVRAEAFVAAIEAGPLTDELVPQIAYAIEDMDHPPAADNGAVDAAPAPVPGGGATEPDAPGAEVPREVLAGPASARAAADPGAAGAAFPEPVPKEPGGKRPEPAAYSFDATIPEYAAAEPEAERPTGMSPASTETSASGVLDVAAVTRAAVASAAEPVGDAPVPTYTDPISHHHHVVPGPPGELAPGPPGGSNRTGDETAALERVSGAASPSEHAAPGAPPADVPDAVTANESAPVAVPPSPAHEPPQSDDEYPLAIPVADWLPDEDAPFGDPGGLVSAAPRPPEPIPADTRARVANITPPPLPPESA